MQRLAATIVTFCYNDQPGRWYDVSVYDVNAPRVPDGHPLTRFRYVKSDGPFRSQQKAIEAAAKYEDLRDHI